MGSLAGRSGLFAWCCSAAVAVGTHILLLWSVSAAPAPRAALTSAASAVTWEALSFTEVAPALEPTPPPPTAASAARSPLRARRVFVAKPERQVFDALAETTAAASAAESVTPESPAPGNTAPLAADSGSADNAGASAKLLHAPRLLTTRDPCAGYFPRTAAANRGRVQLRVDVDAAGGAHPNQTLSELPRGQGFEGAAKACAAQLHFAPARNALGQPVAAQARIELKFDRS